MKPRHRDLRDAALSPRPAPPAMTLAGLEETLASACTLAARIAHEIGRFWTVCPKRTCRRRRRCVDWQGCRAAARFT